MEEWKYRIIRVTIVQVKYADEAIPEAAKQEIIPNIQTATWSLISKKARG